MKKKITASCINLTYEQILGICQILGLTPTVSKNKKKGYSDAQQALIKYVQHLTKTSASVCLIEDIHWADSSTLGLLSVLFQAISNKTVLIINTARPEFWRDNKDWGKPLEHHTQVKINPLSTEYTHLLARELLQKGNCSHLADINFTSQSHFNGC